MLSVKTGKLLATLPNIPDVVTPLSIVSEGTTDESYKHRKKTVVKKITGSIYDCTVNDVITSYMHTIMISSHQRYSRMIKGAHSLRSNK